MSDEHYAAWDKDPDGIEAAKEELFLCGAWQPLTDQELLTGRMPFRCNLKANHLGNDHLVILEDPEIDGVEHEVARWPRRIDPEERKDYELGG